MLPAKGSKWQRDPKHVGSRKNRWQKQFEQGEEIICGICGQPITEIWDITIDHIVPQAMGGGSSNRNLQPAHWLCNQVKADKPSLKARGQQYR